MITLTPAGSPAETEAAYTLLAIIADPKAAQKRLDDIAAEKQDALAAIKETQDATAALEEKRSSIDADLAEAIKIRDENFATFDTKSKQLADQESALAYRAEKADARDADLTARETSVAARESEVKAREDQVFTREVEAKKVAAAAQALKSEYEQKVAALQAALR